jgi:hypothetical protein
MYAYEYGTFVWPQFAFAYRWQRDHDAVRNETGRIYRERTGQEPVELPEESYGFVAIQTPDGFEAGADAAQRIAAGPGGLEMYLDLSDPDRLAYLRDFGIIGTDPVTEPTRTIKNGTPDGQEAVPEHGSAERDPDQ